MKISHYREIFGIDLRSLALFRVLLGFVILLDLALRLRDLSAHYTDFGIMPRSVAMEYLRDSSFSVHFFNGSATSQLFLFFVAGCFALMLIAGYKTRAATVASWALMLSLQNRNTVILSGEDNLLILLLFWAMFLPIGARWSYDSLRSQIPVVSNSYFSVASMALLLQGMSMYFFSALLKSDDRWFPDGTAVYYALQLDYFATTFALWFRQFESLLAGLTYYVHLLEFIGPLLIFSPVFFRQCRALTLLAFITLHLGLFLCLEIGIFWLVSIVMNLLFLPAWVWNKLGDWFNQQPNYKFLQERVIRLVPSNTLKYETSAVKHHRSSTVVSAIAGIVLLFVTVQNLSTLPALNIELPRKFVEVRQLLGLYQNWTMFAPYPEVTSPWPVIAGQLRNGTVVDVYEQSEEAPNFRKPAIVSRVYENYRWRKYLSNMEDRTWEPVPQNLAINYSRYLCRLWNSSHSNEKRLMSLDINFMVERTPIPGQRKLAERRHVWSWKCR